MICIWPAQDSALKAKSLLFMIRLALSSELPVIRSQIHGKRYSCFRRA